jgi:prepilin-type N-terminal cleavage/methylation domain-containing protein
MKKGFTLMELLAVIVILAVIMAITIPKITETLDKASKDTFEDNVQALIKVAKETYLDYAGNDVKISMETGMITVNNSSTEFKYNGKLPEYGCVKISKNGAVSVNVANSEYCAYKVDGETLTIHSIDSTECQEGIRNNFCAS